MGSHRVQGQPLAWHSTATHNHPFPCSPRSAGGRGPGYSPQHQLQVRMPQGSAAFPSALVPPSAQPAHQFSLLMWSPKPGVSMTVSFMRTPFSSISETERKAGV